MSPNKVFTSSGEGWVSVKIADDVLDVEPGFQVQTRIHVFNQGPQVDEFNLRVLGIPQDWLTTNHSRIQLTPGSEDYFTLMIHPPRDPESRAGHYPIILEVTSETDLEQQVAVPAILSVGQYAQIQAQLIPQRIHLNQVGKVIVENQGNAATSLMIKWWDHPKELNFAPPQAELLVSEGQILSVEFRTMALHRRIFSGMRTYPFEVTVGTDQQFTRRLPGQYVIRGIWSKWFLVLVALLSLLLAAGLYWFTAYGIDHKYQDSQGATPGIMTEQMASFAPFISLADGIRDPVQEDFFPQHIIKNTYNAPNDGLWVLPFSGNRYKSMERPTLEMSAFQRVNPST